MSETKTPPAKAGKEAAESSADLPEREPLTPELVEDEAIRGDFMLRWALVLLALLMACTEIAETQTLVHIKSGQYTMDNGMPARTGVFSLSAEDRPWHNVSWLFDVILAGVYSLGGGAGLSVLKAIIGAAIFGLMAHTNRKDISSWWGTICAALALLVCYPQLTAQPQIVTLLGLASTLYLLNRWREDGENRHLKKLVVLFVVWSNLDPRMFLGLAVVTLYACGEFVGNWLGFATGLENNAKRKTLWMTLGICLIAAMVNPFHIHALLSPISIYGYEYPAYRQLHPTVALATLQFYPMTEWSWSYPNRFNPNMIAGLVLLLTALVSFGLNFRRLDFGDLFIGLGFIGFAAVTTHELAAASVVCAVLATLNAGQWYQNTFRQTYSVQTSELVFSRGGRAVTVLTLFGLAYLAISGQLHHLHEREKLTRRTGFGFDYNLQESINGLEDDMAGAFDDRSFNFSEDQGDLLIWIGKKAFFDSRWRLYSGGDDDLVGLFSQTRRDLRASHKPGDAGRQWKPTLDKFQITHVTTRLDSRLSASVPDYITHGALTASDDWQMTRFGPTASVFYRTDLSSENAELAKYLESHRVAFLNSAFRTDAEVPEPREFYPEAATFSDKWLSLPRSKVPNDVLLASHYDSLAASMEQLLRISEQKGTPLQNVSKHLQGMTPPEYIAAVTMLQLRSANAGILRDPQNALAYWLLGFAYERLGRLAQVHIQVQGTQENATVRESSLRRQAEQTSRRNILERSFRHAVCAYRQAVIIDPTNLLLARRLASLYQGHRIWDAAAEMRQRCIDIADAAPISRMHNETLRKNEEQSRDNDIKLQGELSRKIKKTLAEIEKVVPKMGTDNDGRFVRIEAIGFALQEGCIRRAVALFDEDPEIFAFPSPLVARIAERFVRSLLSLGEFERAVDEYSNLNTKIEQLSRIRSWRLLEAELASCGANYRRAKNVFSKTGSDAESEYLDVLTQSIPFFVRSPMRLPALAPPQGDRQAEKARLMLETWSPAHIDAVELSITRLPFAAADFYFNAAMCDLEAGNNSGATKSFQRVLEIAPDTAIRPLVVFYLRMLTGKTIPLKAPLAKDSKANETSLKAAPNTKVKSAVKQ